MLSPMFRGITMFLLIVNPFGILLCAVSIVGVHFSIVDPPEESRYYYDVPFGYAKLTNPTSYDFLEVFSAIENQGNRIIELCWNGDDIDLLHVSELINMPFIRVQGLIQDLVKERVVQGTFSSETCFKPEGDVEQFLVRIQKYFAALKLLNSGKY
jgi:hypothetical protein